MKEEMRDVTLYGDGKSLKHMAWRVKHCVPGGQRLGDDEAYSLAQIALATGLNPFTGEIWYIPGRGPMAGIRGLRRRAREQSTYSLDCRAMRGEEVTEHQIKPDDVGRTCALYRHDVLQRAVEINKAAGTEIVPVKPIIGVGIWRKGDNVPSGKSPVWVADKRAEADALRKAFDLSELPYSDEVNGISMESDDTTEWTIIPEEAIQREIVTNAERIAEIEELPHTEDAQAEIEQLF
jgi:hypothetical protein